MRLLLLGPIIYLGSAVLMTQLTAYSSPMFKLAADGTRLEILIPVDEASLEVRPFDHGKAGPPLMGRVEHQGQETVFVPVAPLLKGQSYQAQWRTAPGEIERMEIPGIAVKQSAPKVRLTPEAPFPANALKFYLHFTEPMEQGVFLERLRLLDAAGKEVVGPFRETELWSPDGKRLTVWFHPGRQKTGVNLNLDEGPVLRPNRKYILEVAGSWRSAQGAAIGNDQKFAFSTIAADHQCPRPVRWTLVSPRAGTMQPLEVTFDEALDPAMLQSALKVRRADATKPLHGKMEVHASATKWSFIPDHEWDPGDYKLVADPVLEDLAGNNLLKTFEVDLENATLPDTAPVPLHFSVR